MKQIHVVAAVIYSPCRQQILIARRPNHLHQGGLWEFPGGKVEPGESPQLALQRELREELNISIDHEAARKLTDISHQYPDKAVHLEFWQVFHFSGDPVGNEGQPINWVSIHRLLEYSFPEANREVVNLLMQTLPHQ
jgi:8-oxo-dGTP diphosphatase